MNILPGWFPAGAVMGRVSDAVAFNGTDERMDNSPNGNGTTRTKFFWNFWIYAPSLATALVLHSADNGTHDGRVIINTDGTVRLFGSDGVSGTHCDVTSSLAITAVAWWNVHIAYDTTLGSGDRVLFTFNGVADTSETVSTAPSGTNSNWGLALVPQYIAYRQNADAYSAFRLARFYHGDSTAESASNFGQSVGGVWKASNYTPAVGNSGFLLDFADPNDLGNDPIQGNDFSLVNMDASNYRTDGPPLAF